jgi:hypothetical protein
MIKRFQPLFALFSLALFAVPLAGCGDPEADQRAKKMENAIDAQREGMKNPGAAIPQGK